MRSIIATHHSRKTAKKPTGVIKLASSDPCRPIRALRSLDKYFWYTSTDGVRRLATSSGTRNEIPRQINDYIFNTSIFADAEYPPRFSKDGVWPPEALQDLLYTTGSEDEHCVGDRCYTSTICKNPSCGHTFENWKHSTRNWQDHFELRKTDDRGIGVYTKRAFKKGNVLGWYAGELIPDASNDLTNDYLMEMPIGSLPEEELLSDSDSDDEYQTGLPSPSPSRSSSSTTTPPSTEETVIIDGSRKGNWTRFINHSCKAHCGFRVRRVGNIRIMTIEAIRNVPAGEELSVNYGVDYYGPNTKKICYCGTSRCVSRHRKERQEGSLGQGKKRVKKCRRLTPPAE